MSNAHWEAEQDRIKKAAQDAIEKGREILTPAGAAYLFGKSFETIRKARRAEPSVAVAFPLGLENRPVHMLRLQWAKEKWAKDIKPHRLDEMRSRCHTLAVGREGWWVCYLILHDKPIERNTNIYNPTKWDKFENAVSQHNGN